MSDTSVDRSAGMPPPASTDEAIVIDDLRFIPMIMADEIAREVDRIAMEITHRHRGLRPLLLCVLNGAAPFHADLIRRLRFPLEVDYIRVSSYNGGAVSSGTTRITALPSTQMEGRNVIVVDDVVDTGRTIIAIVDHLRAQGTASIETAALLYKPEADTIGASPGYTGFRIPNVFVVGYGLDYHGLGRNLEHVFVESGESRGGRRKEELGR